jgi:hypothetical protein
VIEPDEASEGGAMKAAVIYESWFGNTKEVAEAIAAALDAEDVVLAEVSERVPDVDELDLLVVGAPTHAHGLSSALTRKSAIEQSGRLREPGDGIRGWLRSVPDGHGRAAAAFDTRGDMSVLLVGSAARGVARRLRRLGYELVAPPESFIVTGTPGPLKDGELQRATRWAQSLAIPVSRT